MTSSYDALRTMLISFLAFSINKRQVNKIIMQITEYRTYITVAYKLTQHHNYHCGGSAKVSLASPVIHQK